MAVFMGLWVSFQGQAQLQDAVESDAAMAAGEEYTIEWVKAEYPPFPPVTRDDGVTVPWEEVYGPPGPEWIQVEVYKNPPPEKLYDPEARWMEIKSRLAPQLFEDGKLKPEAEAMLNKGREAALAKGGIPGLRPKVDAYDPQLVARSEISQFAMRGEPEGGNGPLDNGNPRLELVQVDTLSIPGWTVIDLWLIDAPQGEWWDFFSAPVLKSAEWQPIYVGAPHYAFDNVQGFTFYFQGEASENYFTAFLHQDVDYDGIADGFEAMLFKTDPNNPDSASARDADENGQPDYPNLADNEVADGDEDFDGDGLSNLYELQLATDPFVAQNSAIDSDADGLPDWLENLITLYTSDPDPAPNTDSDGDGLDNITEWKLGMDPSWAYDSVLANFGALPDDQRVVVHQNIQVGSSGMSILSGLAFTNAPEAYFDASFVGYHGTAAELIVLKDTDVFGNYAPGVDTFKWGAAFQSPASFVPVQNIPQTDPADGPLEDADILTSSTEIFADAWDEAKVNSRLDTISEPSLVAIQKRSFTRMWVRFRQLQLMTVAQPLPQGLVLRTRLKIAQIHTQATIMRKATLIVGQNYPGTQALARMGRFVPVAGSFCSVLSFAGDANAMVQIYAQYFLDVKRRCDNNNDTALDLAVALSSVLDVAFPAPVNSALLWPIWWNLLSNFDGWSSSC
jgi:hypothetical protein